MASKQSNCYNPGDDLGELTCMPKKCDKKRNYEASCMYNSQGQFICEQKTNPELGVEFILGHPKKKITVAEPIS